MAWFRLERCFAKGCEKVGGNGLVLFGEMVRLYTIQWLGFGLGDGGYAVSGWARIKTVLPICMGDKEMELLKIDVQK